jgi:CheY-like chemotaxis protein
MVKLSMEKPVVLCIDDEPEALVEITDALTASGYECHACSHAEGAFELAQTTPVDLIVSDINLAGESGLKLAARIKANEELRDIPVIFLSGAKIPNVIRRSHEAGGSYYLRKPFDPEVLVELVEKALWMPHLVNNRLQQTKADATC